MSFCLVQDVCVAEMSTEVLDRSVLSLCTSCSSSKIDVKNRNTPIRIQVFLPTKHTFKLTRNKKKNSTKLSGFVFPAFQQSATLVWFKYILNWQHDTLESWSEMLYHLRTVGLVTIVLSSRLVQTGLTCTVNLLAYWHNEQQSAVPLIICCHIETHCTFYQPVQQTVCCKCLIKSSALA